MPANMTLAMLREHLRGEVDERLLRYVAANAHKVLYISLEQLCERADITMTEAVDFLHAFDAKSFVAFKYILRKCLYYESTDRGMVKRSLPSLLDECVRFELHNLIEFSSSIDYDRVDRLARDVWAATEVNAFCAGATRPLGYTLQRYLTNLKIPCHLFGHREKPEVLEQLSPDGLVIVFGFARYHTRLLTQMKLLRQRGLRIVCVTDRPDSPFIPFSDYHFLLPVNSFDFNDSYVAGIALIHALNLAMGLQREESLFSYMHAWDVETQETNMFW